MHVYFKIGILFSAIFTSACTQLNEDACYDIDHLWDPENKVCSDDCISQGGIFEVANKRCEIPLSGGIEIKEKDMFASVQSACSEFKNLLYKEFDLEGISALNHAHALQYDYPRVAPISYANKYNYGQDGVCNFTLNDNDRIRLFIRKNARIKSKYFTDEFDVLKIEKNQFDTEKPNTIWERD